MFIYYDTVYIVCQRTQLQHQIIIQAFHIMSIIKNNQDFTDLVNNSLDQTKNNINRLIDESKKQIPQYNDIVKAIKSKNFASCKRNIRELYRISKDSN